MVNYHSNSKSPQLLLASTPWAREPYASQSIMQMASRKLLKWFTSLEKRKVTCNVGEVRNNKLVVAKCGAKFSHQLINRQKNKTRYKRSSPVSTLYTCTSKHTDHYYWGVSWKGCAEQSQDEPLCFLTQEKGWNSKHYPNNQVVQNETKTSYICICGLSMPLLKPLFSKWPNL